jgi:hypothetical protein
MAIGLDFDDALPLGLLARSNLSPERRLWLAVAAQAILEASKDCNDLQAESMLRQQRAEARRYILYSQDARRVFELAGVLEMLPTIRRMILSNGEFNLLKYKQAWRY